MLHVSLPVSMPAARDGGQSLVGPLQSAVLSDKWHGSCIVSFCTSDQLVLLGYTARATPSGAVNDETPLARRQDLLWVCMLVSVAEADVTQLMSSSLRHHGKGCIVDHRKPTQ